MDLLAEINHTPRILSDVDTALNAKQIKDDVDEYLKVKTRRKLMNFKTFSVVLML